MRILNYQREIACIKKKKKIYQDKRPPDASLTLMETIYFPAPLLADNDFANFKLSIHIYTSVNTFTQSTTQEAKQNSARKTLELSTRRICIYGGRDVDNFNELPSNLLPYNRPRSTTPRLAYLSENILSVRLGTRAPGAIIH